MRKRILGAAVEFDRLSSLEFGFDFTGWRLVVRSTVGSKTGLHLRLTTDRTPGSYASLTQFWLGTHYLSIWR